MQVYKSYFKVLNKYKGFIIMYICIFSGVLSAMIASTSKKGEGFVSKQCKVAIFDYDESAVSRALVDYLTEQHLMNKKLKDDKTEIQDAIYNMDIDVVLRIEEGFGERLKAGDAAQSLDLVTIPGLNTATLFEQDINSFLGILQSYLDKNTEEETAIAKTRQAMSVEVSVTLPDGKKATHSLGYQFYNYLGWVMIVMLISVLTPVLQVFNRGDLRKRIECSSYHYLNLNRELLFGTLVSGVGICALLGVLSVIIIKNGVLNLQGVFWMLNLLCYTMVALALAFLVSKLTSNAEIVSMIANTISLGMAFLCGTFVPFELLSDGVKRVAQFLPTYWYTQACIHIDNNVTGLQGEIFMAMGVEILFALVLVVIGMIAGKKKVKI